MFAESTRRRGVDGVFGIVAWVDLWAPAPKNEAAESRITCYLVMKLELAAVYGSESQLTCAFAPPIPNEFTLTRSARSIGHGIDSNGTFRLNSSNGTGIMFVSCQIILTDKN